MKIHQANQFAISREFVSLNAVRGFATLDDIDAYCIDAPRSMPAGCTRRIESESGPIAYGPTVWRR
jgi:hypothetical protein